MPAVDAWAATLGRLRDVVRQHVLAQQLSEVMASRGLRRARVLDVGCGQGTQALILAQDGHEVTGLDISTTLLSLFQAAIAAEPAEVRSRITLIEGSGERAGELTTGMFDVVLCHGVLMYLDDPSLMLRSLSGVSAPEGTLSLLVRNGLSMAMRAGMRGQYGDALIAFDTSTYVNGLGLPARAHTPAELDGLLHGDRWRRGDWYGVRIFTDHRDDEAAAPDELPALLAAECEAGRRDPYRQVAALLHLTYQRQC